MGKGASAATVKVPTWYTAPLNTVYQDDEDWARDFGSAVSTFFHTVAGPWTIRFQSRAVWHVDILRELTINNANIYSPTSTFANPNSLLRQLTHSSPRAPILRATQVCGKVLFRQWNLLLVPRAQMRSGKKPKSAVQII